LGALRQKQGLAVLAAFFCLLFFAAAKKSRCRPAQGQRVNSKHHNADASAKTNTPTSAKTNTPTSNTYAAKAKNQTRLRHRTKNKRGRPGKKLTETSPARAHPSPRGDIHRNFKPETHVGISRGSPLHVRPPLENEENKTAVPLRKGARMRARITPNRLGPCC